MAQVSSMQSVTEALKAMVNAQGVESADASHLMSLVQSSASSEEDSDETGAPSAASYENQSGGIVEALEGLLSKSEGTLEDLRKEEQEALNAFQMQKQSLDDKIRFAKKEMAEAKKTLASTQETKATAEGDLDVTTKDLKEDQTELGELHHECLTEATSFEDSTKSRGEELKALAAAKKIIQESTGGAASQSYGLVQETSFVQAKAKDGETARAVNMVRHLAMSLHSQSLVQLTNRMQTVSRSGTSDPFGKVKSMI